MHDQHRARGQGNGNSSLASSASPASGACRMASLEAGRAPMTVTKTKAPVEQLTVSIDDTPAGGTRESNGAASARTVHCRLTATGSGVGFRGRGRFGAEVGKSRPRNAGFRSACGSEFRAPAPRTPTPGFPVSIARHPRHRWPSLDRPAPPPTSMAPPQGDDRLDASQCVRRQRPDESWPVRANRRHQPVVHGVVGVSRVGTLRRRCDRLTLWRPLAQGPQLATNLYQ